MRYINLHTHQYTANPEVFGLVNQYPDEFDDNIPNYSIGIHPWRINQNTVDSELAFMEQKLQSPNCLAIGECGLDKRIETPIEIQISVFQEQLLLASAFQKPVIIHCVAAFQEVIEIKNRLKITVPMIIHGFSKSEQLAKSLIDNGFYISFGKYLLINPELEMVFKSVPNEHFFLETDTIEEGIEAVYKRAASYKKLNVQEIQRIVNTNFNAVFNLKSEL